MHRTVENLAWLAGVCLIGIYIAMRGWSAHAAEREVDRMREVRAQLAADGHAGTAPAQDHHPSLHSAAPDTSSWSPKRISDYRETLQHEAHAEAVLRVPRLGIEVPVYEGTSDFALNRGAGRIAGTAAITSEVGNVGIAAHRDGFFRPLKDIAVGDEMFLDSIAATRRYRVSRIHVVEPGDVSVLDTTSTGSITLVTCYPFYFVGSAPQRFIVHAQVDEQKTAQSGE